MRMLARPSRSKGRVPRARSKGSGGKLDVERWSRVLCAGVRGLSMALDRSLLQSLLRVEQPWSVRSYRFDFATRKIDIWIGPGSVLSWFGVARKTTEAIVEHQWRHDNLGGWHSYIHLSLPAGTTLPNVPWTGAADQPLTRSLAHKLLTLLGEGVHLRHICEVLDLSLDEVWKYRYAAGASISAGADADTGEPPLVARGTPPPRTAVRAIPTPPPASPPPTDGSVPDLGDPIWQHLLEGRVHIDIRILSLKLLLSRMRTQLAGVSDEEIRLLRMRELHRYFVRNERMLGYELYQIKAA